MRVHFFLRHVRDTVISLEEVPTPPPTVNPTRHAGALLYTKQEAPRQLTVRQGCGEEAQTAGRGGAGGEFGEGLSGLYGTAGDSDLVQVPGTGYDSRG